MIPFLPRIETYPCALNERMWLLVAKEKAGTITAMEQLEVNLMFLSMDSEQDNREANHG